MQRSDLSVGPGSWYWPTRSKLLVGLIIAVVVLILFIVVNPRGGGDFPGGGGVGGAGSARALALRIEQMPIPPFNVLRLTHVRCVLSADRNACQLRGHCEVHRRQVRARRACQPREPYPACVSASWCATEGS